nr:hypothetical protein [Tanacetum cinerariifolium]
DERQVPDEFNGGTYILFGSSGVNKPRSDEDRLELMELMVFLLPKVEMVRIGVNAVDLQVFAVKHMLLLKKVVITEATIRDALRLDDAEGVDCLPNEEIFVELARMGYEKPSTKLKFYKAFFSSQWNLVRNVDSTTKFYMYPRFLQLIIRKQVGDISTHTTKYTSPALTQKEQPPSPQPQLQPQPQQAADFPMNLLQEALDACAALTRRVEHLEYDKRVGKSQMVDTSDDTVMDDKSNQGRMIAEMDKDDVVVLMDDKEENKKVKEAKEDETKPAKVQEVVDIVTTAKLITEVVTAASDTVTAASAIIPTAETQAPAATLTVTITAAPVRVAAAPSRRRKRVIIRDPEEESTTSIIILAETKSKDKGKGILVEEPKHLKK